MNAAWSGVDRTFAVSHKRDQPFRGPRALPRPPYALSFTDETFETSGTVALQGLASHKIIMFCLIGCGNYNNVDRVIRTGDEAMTGAMSAE